MSPDVLGTASGLFFALRRLRMSGTLLHVGAHPDDEDIGMLAYLSRGLDIRTVYWSATRGEGGQNRHGPERAEALGVVRTWESLEAREVDGGEVRYGPFYDYGFSKSGEAALAAWGREDVVKEIVRAIRDVRPDVVVSRWRGEPEDGHGHHQAIGLAVTEAFDAAGDPGQFPELNTSGVTPWQPKKLYVSVAPDWQPGEDGAFRSTPAPPGEGVVVLSTGALDPVTGLTYQEMGCLAFNRHRTQGMAFVPSPADFVYSYRRVRSAVDTKDPEAGFFDGIDPTLAGLADGTGLASGAVRSALAEAQAHADLAVEVFRPDALEQAGRHVLEGAAGLRRAVEVLSADVGDGHGRALAMRAEEKLREPETVAARCLGLRLECDTEPARAAPGGELVATVRLWDKGSSGATVERADILAPPGWGITEEPPHPAEGIRRFRLSIPSEGELTSPYWLRDPRGQYRYAWPDDRPVGLAFDPPPVTASCIVSVGEQKRELVLRADGLHREVFSGGFRELVPAVLPAMALEPRQSSHLLGAGVGTQRIELQVAARSVHEEGAKGTLEVAAPPGWTVEPPSVELVLPGRGETHSVRFGVQVPAGENAGVHELRYEITSGDRREGEVVRPVRRGAPGIPRQADETNFVDEVFLISPATVAVHVLDVQFVRTLRYGYIHGADEHVLPALSGFGLDVTTLDEQEVRYADLSRFDAIVVGPHAYVLRDDVRANAGRLLDYVDAGGTLIVQFQGYGYQADGLAPYPMSYRQPHDRVTLADAPVDVLHPDVSLLHMPNEITAADFDGWVLDRGLYFWGQWDPAYVPVLASHDPGEEPKAGGLLVAPYGRGTFVYAAYSFFRQIPAGVQGALRLFANLLAIPEAKILERMALARGLELFAFMTDRQLHDAVRLMSERRFDPGAYLARQGESGDELFVVVDGEVEILKEGPEGSRRFVAGRGEAVGELAALADVPRSASMRAIGVVRTLAMRGRHFRAQLREHPDLAEDVIKLLATRLASTEGAGSPSGSD
ncbi:MAG: PIG-L family deacetylase [Actinomycetota bacterium]